MSQTYAFKQYNRDTMARVAGRSMPISFKQSIEICNYLRGRDIVKAKKILTDTIKKKTAIPFKRFNKDVGHKPGNIAAGRYPIKASREFLMLLQAVEANAQFKGLNTGQLVIAHVHANKAGNVGRFGRQRGRTAKRTHVEIIVQEQAKREKKSKKSTEQVKKEDTAQNSKKTLRETPKENSVENQQQKSAKTLGKKSMGKKPNEKKEVTPEQKQPVQQKKPEAKDQPLVEKSKSQNPPHHKKINDTK